MLMNYYYGNPYPPYRHPTVPMYTHLQTIYPIYQPGYVGNWRYEQNMNVYYPRINDHGKEPYVVNINQAAKANTNFRTALWTGKHLQVTLMNIKPGDDVGLEVHHDVDQFLRIEEGVGLVQMGKRKNQLTFERRVNKNDAIMVPAGTWHNITNTGHHSLKLYSIYAPPEHPFGTVHQTKTEALAAEGGHGHHYRE